MDDIKESLTKNGSRHESAKVTALQTIGSLVEHLAVLQEVLESGRPVPGGPLGALVVALVRCERDLGHARARLTS